MQIKSILLLLPFIVVAAASPLASSDIVSDANTPDCPDYCAGTAYDPTMTDTYICGDSRLGPTHLPTSGELGDLVDPYNRFGNLCPGQFVAKWCDSTTGRYNYPPQDGFQINTDGSPIEGTITLPVGFLIDRFGLDSGRYASPRDAPYMQRSLPPSGLNTPQSSPV